MCSDEVLVERPLLNSPLNGPRTFQTIDTADLAKAHGGWKEGAWGNGDNLLPFRKKWCEWPKSQFPRKVETANNSSWQLPLATNFTFLTINLNFWVAGENANMEYPPHLLLGAVQALPQKQRSRHVSPSSKHEDGPWTSPSRNTCLLL